MLEKIWKEIAANYSANSRHYHTLKHIENLFIQLSEVKDQIEDWDTILFSMFFHDIVYDVSCDDNEELSADFAKNRLHLISFPANKISKCISQITATKSHLVSNENDTNIFTDSDLSIFGQNWNIYSEYIRQIRKEYSIYSDEVYNNGRKKVISHFLNMESIYKTEYFITKFEKTAKANLSTELKML